MKLERRLEVLQKRLRLMEERLAILEENKEKDILGLLKISANKKRGRVIT